MAGDMVASKSYRNLYSSSSVIERNSNTKFASNQVDVALHFGVSVGEVRRWKEEGCTELQEPGYYHLEGIEKWLKRRAEQRADNEVSEGNDGLERKMSRGEKIAIGVAGAGAGLTALGIIRDYFQATSPKFEEPSPEDSTFDNRAGIDAYFYALGFNMPVGVYTLYERHEILYLGSFIAKNLAAYLIGHPRVKNGTLVAMVLGAPTEIDDSNLNFLRESEFFEDVSLVRNVERFLLNEDFDLFDLFEDNYV